MIFDVDPIFNNSEEWYQAIPKIRYAHKNQPFYHLLAENKDFFYIAYVSEQNLLIDKSNRQCSHPDIKKIFQILTERSTCLTSERITKKLGRGGQLERLL